MKILTPKEIAHKYVHGIHDALTDSQEKKDMAEDIEVYANQSKWISVKDELPEENDSVLVYNGNFIAIGYYEKNFKIEDDQSISAIPRKWKYNDLILDWEITHWQPLPESPK